MEKKKEGGKRISLNNTLKKRPFVLTDFTERKGVLHNRERPAVGKKAGDKGKTSERIGEKTYKAESSTSKGRGA